MRWDERQLAMLREMGVRLWLPQPDPAPGPAGFSLPAAEPAEGEAVAPQASALGAPSLASAAPPASSIAALDWPALRDAVVACRACSLCEGRRQTVFGVGHERAHWMIVGEAPGEQEDREGEPFVGKSGQLLDNMLRAIGLTRHAAEPAQQVYIANTIKCRPPGNRNPAPDELAKCEPYLMRQVQLVQPKIIVAMGRFAVQSLLRSPEPIGRLRGRVHRYQGVPLIVTYHPAYLLRNPEEKARAWDDLCLAVETANAVQALATSPA
jgi:uracil-DNA glycosylase